MLQPAPAANGVTATNASSSIEVVAALEAGACRAATPDASAVKVDASWGVEWAPPVLAVQMTVDAVLAALPAPLGGNGSYANRSFAAGLRVEIMASRQASAVHPRRASRGRKNSPRPRTS